MRPTICAIVYIRVSRCFREVDSLKVENFGGRIHLWSFPWTFATNPRLKRLECVWRIGVVAHPRRHPQILEDEDVARSRWRAEARLYEYWELSFFSSKGESGHEEWRAAILVVKTSPWRNKITPILHLMRRSMKLLNLLTSKRLGSVQKPNHQQIKRFVTFSYNLGRLSSKLPLQVF